MYRNSNLTQFPNFVRVTIVSIQNNATNQLIFMIKILFFTILVFMSNELLSQPTNKSESVRINGQEMYYEVHGEGDPLILLHGYSLSSTSWKPYISDFVDDYQVYLIDLTGHGKSSPFQGKLSIKGVAQDLNSLLQHLELDQIKAIGFSFGGDVLYQLALLNPQLISSMITIGAVGTWDINQFPEYLEIYNYANREKFSWLQTSHASDKHVERILDQFQHYTIRLSDQEIAQIQPEVFIIIGDDDDGMDFDEIARMKKHLRRSYIWILPDVSHGAHEGANKKTFVTKAKRFLSKNNNETGR